jgi:hypothetical protein
MGGLESPISFGKEIMSLCKREHCPRKKKAYCVTCYKKEWYLENRERILQERKLYASLNKEKIKRNNKVYREKNKKKLQKKAAAYKAKNKTDKHVFLTLTYGAIKDRCTSKRATCKYWYGKEYLSKGDFFEWAKSDKDFHSLFEAWVVSGNERRLTPSVNRINPDKGYTLDNIEWITVSANTTAANRSRAFRVGKNKVKKQQKEAVLDILLRRDV